MPGQGDFRGKVNQIFRIDNPYNIKMVSEIEKKKKERKNAAQLIL